jgi:hypothetical protein
MQQFVVTGGDYAPWGFLDRGFPLIHTSQDWRDRYLRLLRRSYLLRMLPFLLPLPFAYLVDPGATLLPLLILSPFYSYISYDTWRSYREVGFGAAPPGVYALGVELPMAPYYSRRYFIPWQEIERLEVVRSGLLMRPVVNLGVAGSNLAWTFPLSLLGRSKLATLRSLVEEQPTYDPDGLTPQVPDLVLYPTPGRERMRNS